MIDNRTRAKGLLQHMRLLLISCSMLSSAVAAPALADTQPTSAAATPPKLHARQVTAEMLRNPPADDWLMFRRTLDGWAFSPLTQINRQNVQNLEPVWSHPLPAGAYEGTPIVNAGVMYIIEPFDQVEAVDAATGAPLWRYKRAHDPAFNGQGIKRNAAIFENLLINSSADGFVYALDTASGKLVWDTKVTDWQTQSTSQSGGPIIASGKVISGRNCAREAGPDACVIVAHDARTGKELWRTHTVAKPGEANDESWGNIPWEERVQVGTWMPPTFDPELNLIYYGTSVTGPTPKYMLGGNDKQHLYSTSTLALDADTGRIVWYYQHLLDHWDFDHTFARLLVDTEVAPAADAVAWINPNVKPGERRKILTGIPGKTGIVYTLDREIGEFLWATPTVQQNVVQAIDGATGRVTENPAAVFTGPGQKLDICPSFAGGKNWPEGTYNPDTGLMYMPLQNLCGTITSAVAGDSGMVGMGITPVASLAPGKTDVGTVRAISVKTGETAWVYQQRAGTMSLLSSAGGLVFAGDASGYFKALDADTGQKLWETNLGSPVSGFPITFAVNGRQYVAVGTGLTPQTFSLNRMVPDDKPANDSVFYVFALP